ncbi:PucR family transcriptional regulator [Clostridium felsineum]|uniref:PucR family transcriptional regulator n=1 Tax=Clostridium felsineum TaxID=36839 RepID=UPI0009CDAA5A|nr:helix-turn-helix domain-containing protein [Clostridium felsineum]URZ17135.1 hypothetical protein CLFE_031870 [Clostridium felsineum DSM 794]
MPKLYKLLNFLTKNSYNVKTKNLNRETFFNEVEYLKGQNNFSKNTLYLTDKYQKSPYNILVISSSNFSEACFQVITNNPEKIYKLIKNFIHSELQLSEKKYEIYSSIYNSSNIDEILNAAEMHLNNPIFIVDTSYKIMGRSYLSHSVTDSIEYHNNNTYLIFDTIKTMKKDKCIDDIYDSSDAFFHYSDLNLIFCAIRVNDITIAYICIIEKVRSFIKTDLELVNTLAAVLSTQVQKNNFFITKTGFSEEYYLIDLLTNPCDDLSYIKARLETTSFTLKDNFLVLAIPFKKNYSDYNYNFELRKLIINIKSILVNCISAYYKGNLIFLVSLNCYYIKEKILEDFKNFLRLNKLSSSLSLPFNNLLYIKDFYMQTICTLKLSKKLNTKELICYFEDYIEYYLFSLCKDNYKIKLNTLIHPLILKLYELDNINDTELIKTLSAYLQNNRNTSDTAKKLNIHQSTFFYRFHKIEKILNISLNNSSLLSKFELSLKILHYQENDYI